MLPNDDSTSVGLGRPLVSIRSDATDGIEVKSSPAAHGGRQNQEERVLGTLVLVSKHRSIGASEGTSAHSANCRDWQLGSASSLKEDGFLTRSALQSPHAQSEESSLRPPDDPVAGRH